MNKFVEINIIAEKENDQQDDAVIFSNKIIALFKNKCKTHNSLNEKKVSLNQLINVFCEAIENYDHESKNLENKSRWCLAKVYGYLGYLKGLKIKYKKEISCTKAGLAITWDPSPEDYAEADRDIQDLDLNYQFSCVQDLYIKDDAQKYWFEL